MESDALYRRYQELQDYVGWTDEDARRVQSVAARLDPFLPALIDDFYSEIDRHPEARRVITGGPAQVERLKVAYQTGKREETKDKDGRYTFDHGEWKVNSSDPDEVTILGW